MTATFDKDGYPTPETLEAIRHYNEYSELTPFWKLVTTAFNTHYGRIWDRGRIRRMATGGWSGNEDVIRAMQENVIFWAVYWVSSRTGGLFLFKLPEPIQTHDTTPH